MADTQAKQPATHWFHLPWQIIVSCICIYWYWHPPAPNKAVLILTGVTIVMALLEMRTSHKAIYLILVLCLMFIENLPRLQPEITGNPTVVLVGG